MCGALHRCVYRCDQRFDLAGVADDRFFRMEGGSAVLPFVRMFCQISCGGIKATCVKHDACFVLLGAIGGSPSSSTTLGGSG